MAITLPIPAPYDRFGPVIYKLNQLSSLVNQSGEREIILDFCDKNFQYSCFLSGLYLLIKDWEDQGRTVKIIRLSDRIQSYFRTSHFPSGHELSPGEDLLSYHFKTYTPLTVFSTLDNARENCIDAVSNIVLSQTKYPIEVQEVINFFLTELTNNVADHAEAPTGIVFVQSYREKRFMDISIGDNGIGVLASFAKTDKFHPKNEKEAIDMAVNGSSTKDQSITRGFGLSGSRDALVKGLGGTFCLWSGEHQIIHSPEVKSTYKIQEGAHLRGCFINLRLLLDAQLKGRIVDYAS